MTDLLKDLEAVAGLADKATPGEWVATIGHHVKQVHGLMVVAKNELRGEVAQHNAAYIATLHNFIRTHHAEIAEALADARRYRWLRDEAHKEPHTRSIGIYCEWGSNCDLGSIGGTDADVEVDAAIDAHNSAREDGE